MFKLTAFCVKFLFIVMFKLPVSFLPSELPTDVSLL